MHVEGGRSLVHRWISFQEMGNRLRGANNRLKGQFPDFTHAVKVRLYIMGGNYPPVKTAV